MKKLSFFIALFLLFSSAIFAQIGINTDNSVPDNSAMLDVKSTTKGVLIPRMTQAQIEAISSSANGLQVFCTTDNKIYVYVSTVGQWKEVAYGTGTITPFSCGIPITDSRDGKTYNTVLIGTQCWMAQNLNIGTKINGLVEQTNNSVIEKYCYADLESNCNIYGGLYQWNELMNYTTSSNSNPSDRQGICPTGWHLPSDAEFCQMETYLDNTVNCIPMGGWHGTDVGGKMKETGISHWTSPNTGATNTSGFTALPGGVNYGSGYGFVSNWASFWSATQYGCPECGLDRGLSFNDARLQSNDPMMVVAESGRCLKD